MFTRTFEVQFVLYLSLRELEVGLRMSEWLRNRWFSA